MEYNVDNADVKITFIDVVLGFMQMKNAEAIPKCYLTIS